ncbi:GNAT family N-acetyltransferase [Ectobacillus ponti]|uniref:GNAT family N-acetyltransferase n=1 Tax=Ectobacillus ponti TaxID=2961894 RepID=A0AA42BQA0_9BACI|nr:GNAT family protein [Ectobacillus ponti]MCP8968229.1 GNAT family N-acetyltransferase [Ectobacillus ponti]
MFTYQLDEHSELRLLGIQHAEELYALTDSCRTYLREWLPWVDATKSVEDSRSFIQMTLEQYARSDGFRAGIWHKGQLAGCIGFHGINRNNSSTSIGYWLGEDFQGNGLMAKACAALIHHAFTELGLNRVEIRAAVENRKSRAVPLRLGFTEEGCIRHNERLHGRYVDHVVYGLLREEWQG